MSIESESPKPDTPVSFPLTDWQPPEAPPVEPVEGNWCRLEPLCRSQHAQQLHEANCQDSQGRIWVYLPYGPFVTLQDYEAWVDQAAQSADPQFYAVIDKQSGKATGVASYLRIMPDSGSIEVGHINYSPVLQRTNAATEAMFLMMQRVFDLGYRRYEWKCDALNSPSRRAATRLGFTYEGIFRQATIYKKRNRDTAWYAMIDREWPALRAAYLRWLDADNFDDQGKQKQPLSALTGQALQSSPA